VCADHPGVADGDRLVLPAARQLADRLDQFGGREALARGRLARLGLAGGEDLDLGAADVHHQDVSGGALGRGGLRRRHFLGGGGRRSGGLDGDGGGDLAGEDRLGDRLGDRGRGRDDLGWGGLGGYVAQGAPLLLRGGGRGGRGVADQLHYTFC